MPRSHKEQGEKLGSWLSVQRTRYRARQLSEAERTLQARPPIPQTLHRLLAYEPKSGGFRYHAQNTLPYQVVIVDESSMIDLFLMERLVSALPQEAQLILLGDAEQLPSVAAGAVFRELLSALPSARVELQESYRMRADNPSGRAILSAARRLKERAGLADEAGEVLANSLIIRDQLEAIRFDAVELAPLPHAHLGRLLERWSSTFICDDTEILRLQKQSWLFNIEGGLDEEKSVRDNALRSATPSVAGLDQLFLHLSRARILCLTRRFEGGVEEVNGRLHTRACRRAGFEAPFLAGEPVMMLANDYERQLFNGDQGVILRGELGADSGVFAVFPRVDGGYRAFPLEVLSGRLQHSYAMTVHKAQGSEFDRVAIILPAGRSPLLTRELLYTAMTRSRAGVLFVGDPRLLSSGAFERMERDSGLAERLAMESPRT